jgi:uncharacterized protein YfeS
LESLDDDWALSRENAHPNARRLLKSAFYWDPADDDSPFGNDTGYDTFQFYRAWVRASDDDEDFLHQLFDDWDVDWERAAAIPDGELAARLEEEHFDILTYDDAVIALAFAQLVLAGNTERDTGALALRALERQALPEVIAFRDWRDPAERSLRCAQMREVVQSAI